uniref:hypothetical protein n=1 Tax=Tessaracoccus timonensis TaxID=2161816 RepID=UPI00131F27A6|nr:hypothetical protein [Tessaracoccus timonensis]
MMLLRFFDSRGTMLTSSDKYWNLGQPQWEFVSNQATAPDGAATAEILLYSSGYNIGEALWDQVSFEEVEQHWAEESLGTPVRNAASMRGAIVSDHPAKGHSYSVMPLVGKHSAIAVVDLDTGESRQAPLPGIQGACGEVATPEGDVYIGGWSAGRLLRVDPVTLEVTDLGTPVPMDGFIWNLTLAPDGKVYGGTYPSGSVFSYDPATGETKDFGPMMDGMQYARSIAASPDGTIYVGLSQTHPTVMGLDPETGERWNIPLPEPYASEPGKAYDLNYEAGRLFVRVEQSSTLLVTKDMKRWTPLGTTQPLQVSPPDAKGKYLYFADLESRHLMAYNLRNEKIEDTGAQVPGGVRAFGWVNLSSDGKKNQKDMELATTTFNGVTWLFTGASCTVEANVPGVPLVLSTIGEGPDGRIYAGGMHADGLSDVDPATGESEQFKATVGQAEHLITVGDKLFIGTYPGADLSVFDPSVAASDTNPRLYESLKDQGQDRPHAAALNGTTLAVGSIPDYGRHDGGVTLVDTQTLTHTFTNPIPDQSVLALDALDDGFIGGTGIYGGLGAPPKASEGELFIMDRTGNVTWHGVPIPGERTVTAVRTAPDGTVWCVTLGKLFQFDPATKQVLRVATLEPVNWDSFTSIWASGSIEFLADGRMIVLARETVYEVDPATMSRQAIAKGAKVLIQSRAGELFFARGETLVKLAPTTP